VTTGARVLALFAEHACDPEFADDVEAAHHSARALPARSSEVTE
jgi:hypothetical protein